MKNIFLSVIRRGNFDLNGILKRIDEYHVDGKLTDEDRAEVIAEARCYATPGVNPTNEIQMLWAAVKKLTARVDALEGGSPDGGSDTTAKDFVQPTGAHDAYIAGDMVSYNGKTYTCIAPEGVACVWSPDAMPGYWQVM